MCGTLFWVGGDEWGWVGVGVLFDNVLLYSIYFQSI